MVGAIRTVVRPTRTLVRVSAKESKRSAAAIPAESAPPVAGKAARAVEAALGYAKRGFHVFPLRDSGDDNNRKLPQRKGWPEAATSDAKTIRRWWNLTPGAGIGIATGNGLTVLDVDNKNGKNGDASLATLLAEHGEFPATLSATTPNGGTHYYLRGPDVSNSVDQLGVGLDVRGHHGYVVAPSPARCGTGYAWRNEEEIAVAPQWLISAATSRAKREPAEPSTAPAMIVATLAAEVRSALNALDVDNYDDFIFAGHATYCLGAFGKEAWTTWAQQSSKWRPEDARRWETFAGSSIGYQALFARAQRDGWQNPMKGSAPTIPPAHGARTPLSVAIEHTNILTSDKPRLITFARVDSIVSRPTDWLIRDYLVRYTLASLIGAPGSCKSFLAFDWSACVATGTPWCGREVKRGAAFILSGEGQRGARKRFQGWEKARGVSLDGHPLYIASNLPFLCDPENVAEVVAAIRETVEQMVDEIGIAPALIVVDTVARAMNGADENSTADMGRFVAAMDALRLEWGACVLAVHHTGLSSDNRARGNTSFTAALDSDFFLSKQGDDSVQLVAGEKEKDWRKPPPVLLKKVEIEVEIPGDDGPLIETTLTLLDLGGGALVEAAKREKAIELKRQGLTQRVIAGEVGVPKSTVARWVKDDE